jgi:chloride channel 7
MLLMVVSISLSKFIADYATHPLYHALVEIKCMPHLPQLGLRKCNALDLIPITQLVHSPPVTLLVRSHAQCRRSSI